MAESALEGVVFDLVEAVHVKLPDKTVHFVVPEVVGENNLFEFHHVFYNELESV